MAPVDIDRSEAKELLERLKLYEAKGENLSDDEFHSAVRSVIEQGIATVEQLAEHLKVSETTIEHWQHITPAYPNLRRSVMAKLIERVQDFLGK